MENRRNRGFTLIEIIIVIVIAGILSAGTFIAIKKIFIRSSKSKAINELSYTSNLVSTQISSLLYNRVPYSVIGYDTNTGNFKPIGESNKIYNVLEWIGLASESFKKRDYSGFVDMDDSNKSSNTLSVPDTNISGIKNTFQTKFNTNQNPFDNNLTALVFAGSFDKGFVGEDDYNNTFGWHDYNASDVFSIDSSSSNARVELKTRPKNIYEKYYLVDSAYAIARGEDLNRTIFKNSCDLNISFLKDSEFDNTLFLFYNYRPWKKETFCGDPNGSNKEGNVTVLATEVKGFKADVINNNLQFSLTLQRDISGNNKYKVTISKQKVVF